MTKQFRRRHRKYKLPVVAMEAVQNYLNRPLENYDYMKQVPIEELAAEARALKYNFCVTPWSQQLVGFLIAALSRPDFLFYYDMGAGKTSLLLNIFRYRKKRKDVKTGLILVPETIHMDTWVEQMGEHAPDLKLCVLTGDKRQRMELLTRDADLFLINYAGLQVYMTQLVERHRVLDPNLAADFACNFDFLIIDEIHRIKTYKSLLFELISWLSLRCPYRYAATGTPFGREPETLWPQFKLIDQGATFGTTLGMFRAAFFTAKQQYGSVDYKFRKEQTEHLNQMIKNRSLSYQEHELVELPMKIGLRWPVSLTEEGQLYYDRIVSKLKEERGDYRSLGSAYIRMRQCASGFLSLKPEDDEESNERIQVRFKHNPKLEALRAIIERIAGRKFIVYHHFRYSGRMVAELLEELKINYAAIRGGMRDVLGEFNRFKEDPKCQALVANTQVGSEAINPQGVCNIEVYFESSEDPITRKQAERRVRRPGQKESHVLIYDIIVRDTIEPKLLRYHSEGNRLLKAILAGDESLID